MWQTRLGLLGVASASTDAVVRDALGGLVAYVVPGNDHYSLAQGVSTTEPGGVAAGAVDTLRSTLDIEAPGLAEAAAVILGASAREVAPGVGLRGFASAFAALPYSRKDQVVRTLAESRDATLRVLGSSIPALAVFLSYSEAGVLDRRTGRLRSVPVGWQLTGYAGVADIRDDFRGYYGGHRSALPGGPADFPGHGSLDLSGVSPAPAAELAAVGLLPQGAPRAVMGSTASGRLIGRPLEHFLAHIDRLLSIAILTDEDVDPRNGVTLSSGLPPDAYGRVPRIDVVARTPRSIRNRRFLIREATRILDRAGAVATHRINPPPYLAHIHSTLRMGQRASDSVLDRSGEARWVRRLFVADNSALANALGGPNPTLTTQALATRAAERIFQKYFGGAPWVAHEHPMASTDHRVTAAVRQRRL